jgi:hypothetical protein
MTHGHHTVFDAIADWIKTYRTAIGQQNELANCTPEVVASIARDIGVTPSELSFFTAKGPHASDELPRLLRALGVDPDKLAAVDRSRVRDLQRICITCGHKGQCQHDLAAGTAAHHYREYCPNAISLDALFKSKDLAQIEPRPYPVAVRGPSHKCRRRNPGGDIHFVVATF